MAVDRARICGLTLALLGMGFSAAGMAQESGSKARHVFHDADINFQGPAASSELRG